MVGNCGTLLADCYALPVSWDRLHCFLGIHDDFLLCMYSCDFYIVICVYDFYSLTIIKTRGATQKVWIK